MEMMTYNDHVTSIHKMKLNLQRTFSYPTELKKRKEKKRDFMNLVNT